MPFWELRVAVTPETSEGLTNFLWEQGALGVVEEEPAGEAPRLRAFYPETASSTRLASAIDEYRSALAALGFTMPTGRPEIGPLLDSEWASAWQQSFPPRNVGERLVVLPPWERPPASPRARVVIEPGRAFGTGHHGSTEGCLVLLDAESLRWAAAGAPPARILDVGTGTGILAIAAIRLGAERVRCIDVDPDAVAAAEHNARLNGCADRLAIGLGGVEALDGEPPFDLVLANLLTHTHLALAPHYRRLVAEGGALVLGGMLADEDGRVADALRGAGFGTGARVALDGWASLLLRRSRG
jgi:ribosomal protein L11 methyltransferase